MTNASIHNYSWGGIWSLPVINLMELYEDFMSETVAGFYDYVEPLCSSYDDDLQLLAQPPHHTDSPASRNSKRTDSRREYLDTSRFHFRDIIEP